MDLQYPFACGYAKVAAYICMTEQNLAIREDKECFESFNSRCHQTRPIVFFESIFRKQGKFCNGLQTFSAEFPSVGEKIPRFDNKRLQRRQSLYRRVITGELG